MIGPAHLALLLLLGTSGGGLPEELSVRVLGRFHPSSVRISRPGESHVAVVSGDVLWVDGRHAAEARSFSEGRWRVEAYGGPARAYVGAFTVSRDGGEVAVVVRMALEEYVASVVAAETEPGTPLEALKALAVVARSYAASARGRHEGADLCDLAHCQVMGPSGTGAHRASAVVAAQATAGQALRLEDGSVATAPFHAACGGHTADPVEAFGGEGTGAAAVFDPGCAPVPWQVEVGEPILARIAGRGLAQGKAPASPVPLGSLRFLRGQGGYVIQVAGAGAGSAVGGEAFTRALDRALGHGRIRSARFEVRRSGSAVQFTGSGIGHGVGLCQAGAARRAAEGQGYDRILGHFFPRAHLDPRGVSSDPAGQPAPRWAPLSRTSSR